MKIINVKIIPNIFDFSPEELEQKILSLGLKKYTSRQMENWVYKKLIFSFSEMTNISQSNRLLLEENFSIKLPALHKSLASKDGTVKYAFKLNDGGIIETVLINKKTVCVSSQVGCAYDCKFCVTGKGGFVRSLSSSEITGQLLYLLKKGVKITNIVFMGMGEPLANFDEVVKSIRIINSCLNFSPHRITISTCGIIPKIVELVSMNLKVNLAVSLNATDEKTRTSLMPVNRKYPMSELISAIKKLKFSRREKITFEYILIKGINDSPAAAHKLTEMLKGIDCMVNLIVYNENLHTNFFAPEIKSVLEFQKILKNVGLDCFLRESKGRDIHAACGQLKAGFLLIPEKV